MAEENNEEEEGKASAEALKPTVAQMRELVAQMADESVLDEEKIALKRLMETVIVQMEAAIFAADFFVEEMAADMRAGWELVLAQALHLADFSPEDDDGPQVFVNLARSMLETIDQWTSRSSRFELKESVETPEARKMLTHVRRTVSQADSVLWYLERMGQMNGAEQYQHYIERQTMEMTAQRSHMLKVEGAIVTALEKRGEKVPRWRRKS